MTYLLLLKCSNILNTSTITVRSNIAAVVNITKSDWICTKYWQGCGAEVMKSWDGPIKDKSRIICLLIQYFFTLIMFSFLGALWKKCSFVGDK